LGGPSATSAPASIASVVVEAERQAGTILKQRRSLQRSAADQADP
jgi:hypothetical protein